jgi:hypothetical protein
MPDTMAKEPSASPSLTLAGCLWISINTLDQSLESISASRLESPDLGHSIHQPSKAGRDPYEIWVYLVIDQHKNGSFSASQEYLASFITIYTVAHQ